MRGEGYGMKIGIIGASTEGSLFGGYFAANDHDVSFLDADRALVERVNAEGITVVRPGTSDVEYEPFATTDPTEIGESEHVFVPVKAQNISAAMDSSMPLPGEETVARAARNSVPTRPTTS